jgi:tight adherence protein C
MPPIMFPFAATALYALAVLGWRQSRSTGLERLGGDLIAVDEQPPAPLMVRVIDTLGAGSQRLLLRVYGPRRRMRLDARLQSAGRPEGLNDRSFLRRKAGFTMVGVIMFLGLAVIQHPFIGLLLLLVCFGWMDLWLRTVIRRRQSEIARELPDFLDVVAVTVSAGLGLQQALERVVAGRGTPLGQEVTRMLNDMRYGLGRRAALEALRTRNDVPSVGSFVTAMLQAGELGTPLAQALMEIAGEVRRESAQSARQAAAKAGPKVSLVVSTTIVPGAMLLIGAGLVLGNIGKLRDVFG